MLIKNRMIRKIIISGIIILFTPLWKISGSALAQDKKEITLQLSFYRKSDLSKTVTANVKTRDENNKLVPATGARVNFYALRDKEINMVGSVEADMKGNANLPFPEDVALDSERYFTIVAKIENDPLYEDVEEDVRFKHTNLNLTLNSGDTVNLITAKVYETDDNGSEIPVKEAEVKFYVHRLFGLMPLAEEYAISTDDMGEASFVFPEDIKGDTAGNIILIARIEDSELYGNLESQVSAPWGTSLVIEKNPFPRALSDSKAPLPLILTISILIGGVWITYFFVFYQLRKIKKETP